MLIRRVNHSLGLWIAGWLFSAIVVHAQPPAPPSPLPIPQTLPPQAIPAPGVPPAVIPGTIPPGLANPGPIALPPPAGSLPPSIMQPGQAPSQFEPIRERRPAPQPPAPPGPAKYDAHIRYRIKAGRTERIRQFDSMSQYLERAGFQREPSEDPSEAADPDAERLRGTVPAEKVEQLLQEPHVRTILLTPSGYKLPENPEQRVLVQLGLHPNLSAVRQRDLANQSREKLAALGFQEKSGYDNCRNVRLFGTIPAGEVETLLRDLRDLPTGWLAPDVSRDLLPDPIREFTPIRVIEVFPEPEGVLPNADVGYPPVAPAGQEYLEKIAEDLRPAVDREPAPEKIRMEVILNRTPANVDDPGWRDFLLSTGDVEIEGRLGQIVTIRAPASVAKAIAASPAVATVRPVREATRQPIVPITSGPAEVFQCTGLARLHGMGFRGKGVRVAVIDSSFAGADRLLPGATMLDMTSARNPSLLPDAEANPNDVGRGTKTALAVKLAAPDAELVLIRVDPTAAYMMGDVARYLRGRLGRPESLTARNKEIEVENERLRILQAQVLEDRRPRDDDFGTDEAAVKRRQEREQRAQDLARDEKEYLARLRRLSNLEEGLMDLEKVSVIVNSLSWDVGFPTDGYGALSRYIDERLIAKPQPKPYGSAKPASLAPLWFQATGDTRGQSWNGPLIDADGNGVLEFANGCDDLPKGSWTRELNFLAFETVNGQKYALLPAGARIRIALQWSEAHDPDADFRQPDPYRSSLANLNLLVLRQRDDSHTKLGADDFNVVARSVSLPQMIERSPNSATYEKIVEFTVDTPGRYAVRIEGNVPSTIRPDGLPTAESSRTWEANGRLFIDIRDDATFQQGRAIFNDYAPGIGGLGTPGDGTLVRTVGACDLQGYAKPYSAYGAYAGRGMLNKPTYLTPDHLPLPGVAPSAGTALANGFAGGMVASMISGGAPHSLDLKWLGIPPHGLMKVPPSWLDQISRREPSLNERR